MKLTHSTLNSQDTMKYRKISQGLVVAIVVLFAVVVTIPGALQVLCRADAQVALGNAKSVRFALQTVAKENGGFGEGVLDAGGEGGIAEGLYQEVLLCSKAPGDFWVLQAQEGGYDVMRFVYREGDFTVWYDGRDQSYRVEYGKVYIRTENNAARE